MDLEHAAVVEVTSEDLDFPVESVLRCFSDGGSTLKEIVRQQWNFSPPESIREVEQYQVDLYNVEVLELVMRAEIGGGVARASLKNLRFA